MKIRPEHIPVGSVVEYCIMTKRGETTVHGCKQNGIDSYIFKADGEGPAGGENFINLTHITRIISRGNSSICYIPEKEWEPKVDKVVIEFYLRNAVVKYLPKAKSNDYCVDVCKMVTALKKAVTPIGTLAQFDGLTVHIYRRKNVQKWVKANVNRYLTKKKLMKKLELRADLYDLEFSDQLSNVDYNESTIGRQISDALICALEAAGSFKWGVVCRQVIAENRHLKVEYFSLKLKDGNSHECVFATDAFETIEKFINQGFDMLRVSRVDIPPSNISSPSTFIENLRNPELLKIVQDDGMNDILDCDDWY